MKDGDLTISRLANIAAGEHPFCIKIDHQERDQDGNLKKIVIKLTEEQSKFQVKLRLTERGTQVLYRFFVDDFIKHLRMKMEVQDK